VTRGDSLRQNCLHGDRWGLKHTSTGVCEDSARPIFGGFLSAMLLFPFVVLLVLYFVADTFGMMDELKKEYQERIPHCCPVSLPLFS